MSRAEIETLFRWDHEEQVLWGCTTHSATARRWEQKLALPVVVLHRIDGAPVSWEIKLAYDRRLWGKAMRHAVPHFGKGGPVSRRACDPLAHENEEVGAGRPAGSPETTAGANLAKSSSAAPLSEQEGSNG